MLKTVLRQLWKGGEVGVTREEAAEILEEVKLNDDSMYAYSEPYMTALDMAIGTLKARETSLEKVAADYGLMPDGVAFALEQYQKVLCDITHNRLSKPTYYADDIIRLVHDVQCDGCELIEPRVMTLDEVLALKFDDVVYVEVVPTHAVLSAIVLDVIPKLPKIGIGVVQFRYAPTWNGINNADLSYYDKTWRCWTSRPTDAQREATPWEQ